MSFIDVTTLADSSFGHEGAVQHSTPRLQYTRPISPPKTLITRELLESHIASYSSNYSTTVPVTASTPKSRPKTDGIAYAALSKHRRAIFDAYDYVPLKYNLSLP